LIHKREQAGVNNLLSKKDLKNELVQEQADNRPDGSAHRAGFHPNFHHQTAGDDFSVSVFRVQRLRQAKA
jgi:hypothetical protein